MVRAVTAAAGYFGTRVAQRLGLLVFAFSAIEPAQAAGLAGEALVGCWRHDQEDIGNATRMTFPSGEPGLSWGIDPETGEEVVGMVPHSKLCFAADGSMTTGHYGVDEGLEDSGTYRLAGGVLKVHSDYPGDGWLFGASVKDSSCAVAIEGNVLSLTNCSPADEWLDVGYTRSPW
jgi:hypothetical protein